MKKELPQGGSFFFVLLQGFLLQFFVFFPFMM